MSKVHYAFHMPDAPAAAQALFVEDLATEFHQKFELALAKEEPGHLLFSDGLVDVNSLPPLASGAIGTSLILGGGAGIVERNDVGLYSALREITAHHLHVEFEPDGSGTLVKILGHVESELREAIECFGSPGHWPDNGRVHD